MDRRTVFPGQLPLVTDLLATGQHAMVGLAKLSEACLGTSTVADGFTLAPTAPLGMTANLSPGTIYQQTQLESSAWSSLPPDVRPIVKQGIALDTQTLTFVAPPTVGYAWNALVQIQYGDQEDGVVVRPYYNAANPAQPFSGPGNTNQPTPQTRRGAVVVNIKYGPAANVGSQPTPAPDPGWIGLYVVTVPNGTTQITSGLIATYTDAPTVIAKLPTIPYNIQANVWKFFADTSSTQNLIIGSPTPALKAYQTAVELQVLVGNTNTGPVNVNISGRGLRALTRRDGTDLQPGDIVRGTVIKITDDGVRYRLDSLAQGEVARIVNTPVFYVRTDGNDDNDGQANTPDRAFKTLRGAVLNGTNRLTLAGRTATIILGIPGTYAAPNFPGVYANAEASLQSSGTLLIQGLDIAQGNTAADKQGQYIIAGVGAAATTGILHISFGAQVILRGLRIQNDSTGSAYHSLTASTGSAVYIEYVTFGGAGQGNFHIYSADNAVIRIGPGCVVQSGGNGVLSAGGGGITQIRQSPITLQGNLTFNIFAYAEGSGGRIQTPGASGFVATGTITGTRYQALNNATINSFGGGANYFPGSAAGSVSAGGLYV